MSETLCRDAESADSVDVDVRVYRNRCTRNLARSDLFSAYNSFCRRSRDGEALIRTFGSLYRFHAAIKASSSLLSLSSFVPFSHVAFVAFVFECMLMVTLIRPCLRPIFRKCFHTAYYFLDYPPRNVPTLQEWENTEQDGERTAVAIQKFVQHVASLHADGDIGFSKEYEFIQSETGKFTAENSQYVENKAKNRYLNILACE